MHFNFKIQLLEALVRVNYWPLVDDIIGRIYDFKLDLTISRSLLEAMFDAMNWFVEPLYAVHSKSKRLPLLCISKTTNYFCDPVVTNGQLR